MERIAESVNNCDIAEVKRLVQKAVDDGATANEIVNQGLVAGMNVVGQRFKGGEMFVPEVLMAARAMNEGMNIVKPLLVEGETYSSGTVVLGTVAGDLHDIGKNLVGLLMESGGLNVVDLGVDVAGDKFVEAVKEHQPDVLALSALLTTTMLEMKEIIDLLVEEGIRDKVKIIIGGAPVSQDFADQIGANGWAPDAASAKDLVLSLISDKS